MSSKPSRNFVCAHCNARDWYELPRALQEAGMLEVFCTDFYSKNPWRLLLPAGNASGRRAPDGSIPDGKVKVSLATMVCQLATRLLISDKELRAKIPDDFLMRMLRRQADKKGLHILTYEPWVVPRPAGGFRDGCRQVIFHCHPHVDWEDEIYARDRAKFPLFYTQSHVTASPWRRRTADAWRHADLVVCASSFTKQSLIAAGLAAEKCVVVPYGTNQLKAEVTGAREQVSGVRDQRSEVGGQPERSVDSVRRSRGQRSERNGALKLLFVGRNPLRKGLHHLLLAWSQARRRPGDTLTVVCAERPQALTELAVSAGGVEWLPRVSTETLRKLYANSDALVVPSLCEGFGHVYLEAMSYGCPVVGTSHSMLADLDGVESGVFVVGVGDVESLSQLITAASANRDVFGSRRSAAAAQPLRFTWEAFRTGLVQALRRLDAGLEDSAEHNDPADRARP